MRIHVAEIVGRRSGKARHRAQFEGENGLVVDAHIVRHALCRLVPRPACRIAEGRFARLGGEELRHLRQFEREALFRHEVRHAVFIVHGEGFTPIALTAENGVAQTVVRLHASQPVRCDKSFGGGDGLFHRKPVEREALAGGHSGAGRIGHGAFFRVEALFAHIRALDERHDGEVEVTGESIVAAVVRRHRHDGPRAVARQHIVRNPHRDFFACEGIHRIATREHATHPSVGDAFAFRALGRGGHIGLHLFAAVGRGELRHEFAFGSEHHEGYPKNRVGTGGEDRELHVAVFHRKLHLRAFRTTDPVALRFFDRIGPVEFVESVEQSAGIGTDAQTPLLHLLLHHGVSAAFRNAVHHFVVRQHRAERRAPVHHRLAEVGNAIVHQHLLTLHVAHRLPFGGGERERFAFGRMEVSRAVGGKMRFEFRDGAGFFGRRIVVRHEHARERPLRPFVVFGRAGAHLARPVEGEADFVELFAVAGNVLRRGHRRVLSGLNGILLSRQPVGIVAHGIEHIVAAQTTIACIDIGSDVAQRVTDVQAGARRVGKHVEDVKFRAIARELRRVSAFASPRLAPPLFDVSEIIFHFAVVVSRYIAAKLRQL